ncbi:MAG: nucleotidyl transferase AbiEii/AbiGii toxin family protein [Flammeovirgaceae bacterium]
MSNTSNLTYRDLAIPYFLEVFQIVDEVVKTNGAPYYLIGVNATDIQLLKQGIRPSRGTKDIDFAVMVSSFREYDKIILGLIAKGFNKVKDAAITLYHPAYNVAIDVLPFGEVEESHTLNFTEREVMMNVLGFKEALYHPKEILIDDVFTINVPPLHGMVILKLISWSDRPEIRATDLDDIFRIVKHYYDTVGDDVFGEHFDLLEADPFDEKLAAARMMGRRIAAILKMSAKLMERVMTVIRGNTADPAKSSIGKHWASKNRIDVEYGVLILKNIQIGIEEKL